MVRWLHLSDFHFAHAERWDRRATLRALLEQVEKLKAEGLGPDWVFFTGDVAWSGKKLEYEQAGRFFGELAGKLGLKPAKHFFMVPGNHDVDRSAIGYADGLILDQLRDQEGIESLWRDKQAMDLLARRLEHFYAFTEQLLGPARGWQPGKPWRVDVREVGGVQVAILQLNSASASGPKDEMQKLLVGEPQLREVLEEGSDSLVRIALVHHPRADLRDFDRDRVEGLLGAPGGAHFLLRGHLHKGRTLTLGSPDGLLVELAAGTVYTDGMWPRAFLLTELDFGGGAGKVHFFRYSPEGKGFWHRDPSVYERAPEGIWRFVLPPGLAIGGAAPELAEAPHREARRASLAARYRSAAAAVYGTVRFLGFADARPRPTARVPELFVPLRLRKGEKEVWETAELLRFLTTPKKKQTPRAVVLGDPGSGKTTLCRFAAVLFAGEAQLAGVEVGDEILPLFLPFREYVRQCREKGERGLVGFLEEQARDHLQVALPEGFLENKLEAGQAVLLLDGLDEVGSGGEREEMRERVLGFGRSYPRVAMLVTSRIAGYTEAPLPGDGPDGFAHLHLTPFKDEDLREFVRHWYAIQEAEDFLARDRGIVDLLGALEADSRVRELARNPMLATLIALVHRYEAHLPGERAKLYELCVKTLLETWPAARRRMFHEIDVGLQRAYLEALAWRMQTARQDHKHNVAIEREALALRMQTGRKLHERDVTIERQALVEGLKEIVKERGDSSVQPSVLERWVLYLETDTGLLVEQRPGVFAFFHLSLMEYLAACALDSAGNPENEITKRYGDADWREVCLLAVGKRATDKRFLDRLFVGLKAHPKVSRWPFLLACLREEAAFDASRREEIVSQTARILLKKGITEWSFYQRMLEELMNLSMRHGKWVRIWVEDQLKSATGENLKAIVAIRLSDEKKIIEWIALRPDAQEISGQLIDFWPGSLVGKWASDTVSPSVALVWGSTSAGELQLLRSLFVFALCPTVSQLMPGLLIGQISLAAASAALALRGEQKTGACRKSGEKDLPAIAIIEPYGDALRCEPRWLCGLMRSHKDSRRYFSDRYVREFSRDIIERLTGIFSGHFVRKFSFDLTGDFARYYALGYGSRNAHSKRTDHIRNFAHYFGHNFSLRLFSNAEAPKVSNLEPSSGFVPPDLEARNLAMKSEHAGEQMAWLARMYARFAAESRTGSMFVSEATPSERQAYVHRRVQNAWLLHIWPMVDQNLGEDHAPDRLALYLALGWTQATTTWQWPATDRWIALLKADPPTHWMPRTQWHLCWLLHDPDDPHHRQALDTALEEGLADPDRPGLAEAMCELFPIESS